MGEVRVRGTVGTRGFEVLEGEGEGDGKDDVNGRVNWTLKRIELTGKLKEGDLGGRRW